ncbi:hypothetical protein KJ359_001587 [Pestalotiopsis sp. 9143b]|nr:hypothetical protein KJ359_001587 [Pestalotiopsis sp. 9143b]
MATRIFARAGSWAIHHQAARTQALANHAFKARSLLRETNNDNLLKNNMNMIRHFTRHVTLKSNVLSDFWVRSFSSLLKPRQQHRSTALVRVHNHPGLKVQFQIQHRARRPQIQLHPRARAQNKPGARHHSTVTDEVMTVSPQVIQAKKQQVLHDITARLAAEDKLRQDASRRDAAARSSGL